MLTGFNFAWATEPQDIIDYYANKSNGHYQKSGNVLAYKNYANQTIVLKSGNHFENVIECEYEANDDVIVVPLKDVIAIVGLQDESVKLDSGQNIFEKYNLGEQGVVIKKNDNGTSIIFNLSENEIKNYINLATKNTSEEWEKQFIQHQQDRLNEKNLNLVEIKQKILTKCESQGIQNLDQLRHTEFQIHAILNSFCSVLNTLELKKDDLMKKEVENFEIIKRVKILQLLLPANFTLDVQLESSPVYSLFEACNSCKLVPWLTMNDGVNKNHFMFKVLDSQVLKKTTPLCSYYQQTIAEKLSAFLSGYRIETFKGIALANGKIALDVYHESTCKKGLKNCKCIKIFGKTVSEANRWNNTEYKKFKTGTENINIPQELQSIVIDIIDQDNR